MDVAKWMVAFVAVYNFGGLVFDGVVPKTARMHLYNPAWKPHAKFHNCQTMLMGCLLGALALTVLFASRPLTMPALLAAIGIAGTYFVALALAPLFPGTAWVDPEFSGELPGVMGLHQQQFVGYVLCLVLVAAFGVAWFSR